MIEIDIYAFTNDCWKCGEAIELIKPAQESLDFEIIGEAVIDADLGNVQRTYSRTQESETIANVCPKCKSLQGNFYVTNDFISHANWGGEFEVITTLQVQLICRGCGTEIDDFPMFCKSCQVDRQERSIQQRQQRIRKHGEACHVCEERFLVLLTHHTSYYPEETVDVCGSCHAKIHRQPGFRDDLKPDRSRPKDY